MKKLDKMLYSVNENIAILTINRPERRNALDSDTLGQINLLMDRAENDEKVRVILINGQGDTFSSGFDLKDQMEKAPQGKQWKPILELDHQTIMRFWNSPKLCKYQLRKKISWTNFHTSLFAMNQMTDFISISSLKNN